MTHTTEKNIDESGSKVSLTNQGSEKSVPKIITTLEQDLKYPANKIEEDDEEPAGQISQALDGGFGWIIVSAVFVIMLCCPSLGPSFGVMFSKFLIRLNTTSTTTAWILNIQSLIWNLTGLIVGPLTAAYSWRSVAFVGCSINALGIFISAFAPSAQFLYLSFSLFTGMGGSLATSVCFFIIPHYFERRRGIATSIMMAGVGLGLIGIPPLINFLQDEFGFRGGTMIIAAILFNSVAVSFLFHPVEWHFITPVNADEEATPVKEIEKLSVYREDGLKVPVRIRTESMHSPAVEVVHQRERSYSLRLPPEQRYLTISCQDISDISAISSIILNQDKRSSHGLIPLRSSFMSRYSSTTGLGSRNTRYSLCEDSLENDSIKDERINGAPSIIQVIKSVLVAVPKSFKILSHFRALIISISLALGMSSYVNFVIQLPFAVQSSGHDSQEAAVCVSIVAFSTTVTRLGVTALTDHPRCSMRGAYMSGLFLTCTSAILFSLVHDLTIQKVVLTFYGFGVGGFMGLHTLAMIQYLGLENLPAMYGSTSLMVAVAFMTVGPAIGAIRDASESFSLALGLSSVPSGIGFILWSFMPLAIRVDKNKKIDPIME